MIEEIASLGGYDGLTESGQQGREMQEGFKRVFPHGKNNDTRARNNVKPKMIMHASDEGRERKRNRYRTSDTKDGQTSKNMKLCTYFVQG